MSIPSIDVAWLTTPPKLDRILGDSHPWTKYYSHEVVEVETLAVDSIGTFPLFITVKIILEGVRSAYREVHVQVKNAARMQKWKPGLDWYRHVFGVPELVNMQNEFRSQLAKKLEMSVEARKGNGISLQEVEVIIASIYRFVCNMDELAHQCQERAKESRCPLGGRQYAGRKKEVVCETIVAAGPEVTADHLITIDHGSDQYFYKHIEADEMSGVDTDDDDIYFDEDNRETMSQIWYRNRKSSGNVHGNILTVEDDEGTSRKQWKESWTQLVDLDCGAETSETDAIDLK